MTQPAPGDRDKSRVNAAIRQLYAGGANNRGVVTLRANQTTTSVVHEGVNPNSHISIMPLTDSALKAMIPQPLPNPKQQIFTRALNAATGNVSYTGFGFKPALVELYMGSNATAQAGCSIGSYDGVNSTCLDLSNTFAITFYQPTICGVVRDPAAGANDQVAAGFSLDADGFTLTWTKGGTPPAQTINITATCYPDKSAERSGGVKVLSRTTGSFVLSHQSDPAVDQTFTFSVTGGAP